MAPAVPNSSGSSISAKNAFAASPCPGGDRGRAMASSGIALPPNDAEAADRGRPGGTAGAAAAAAGGGGVGGAAEGINGCSIAYVQANGHGIASTGNSTSNSSSSSSNIQETCHTASAEKPALATRSADRSPSKVHPVADGDGDGGGRGTLPWRVEASNLCLATVNPIRRIADSIAATLSQAAAAAAASDKTLATENGAGEGERGGGGGGAKDVISLAQGDPTRFGHLPAAAEAVAAVRLTLDRGGWHGYTPSAGLPEAREAIAEYLRRSGCPMVEPDDVLVTSGCGPAIQVCLGALANPGKNILLPRPGFPVYDCWCSMAGIEIRHYSLLPEREWEIDCEEVERLADENTVALFVCNPGNPCGNVFSRRHIEQVVELARRLRLPILADEIYEGITFGGTEFVRFASVAGDVPVLTVSSISKRFLVPGWRLGWVAVHDPVGILRRARVLEAMMNLQQNFTDACSLIQAAIPHFLNHTDEAFFSDVNRSLEQALTISLDAVAGIKTLECPSKPHGGMFLMVRINLQSFPQLATDEEWCRQLLAEEAVVLLPGSACEFPGWFRLFLAVPSDELRRAWTRISNFCAHHERPTLAPPASA